MKISFSVDGVNVYDITALLKIISSVENSIRIKHF